VSPTPSEMWPLGYFELVSSDPTLSKNRADFYGQRVCTTFVLFIIFVPYEPTSAGLTWCKGTQNIDRETGCYFCS